MAKRLSWRRLIELFAGLPFMSAFAFGASAGLQPKTRVRPGDAAWPSDAAWDELGRAVEGRLIKVQSPLAACVGAAPDAACAQVFKELKNPYFLGDEPGLTQSLGWVGAWTSQPSVYAVAAKTTRRCRCGSQLRPQEQSQDRGQGRRPQLPGNLERRRLLADLDPPHERDRHARRLRRRGLRGPRGAAAGGVDRGGRILAPGLRRGDDQGRALRARGRLHDGRRRRSGARRRLRQLLQSLRHGRREPHRGRDRHRRRRGQNRQRLLRIRISSGRSRAAAAGSASSPA